MILDQAQMPQRLYLKDSELARYWPQFLTREQSDQLFERCLALPWEQPSVQVFGRRHQIPRMQCWLGEHRCDYRYSGTLLKPQPLPSWLNALMFNVSQHCGTRFNAVLANRYRSGDDKMGWHSDNEPEMGQQPQVAIVSLGAGRPLQLRSQDHQQQDFTMPHGSLLQLLPLAQRQCKHQLPARKRVEQERISLTFRYIIPGFWH
ncbi:Alkylated DNA repair dioxygenase AlkB [Ferrimonas sediminum]|uniref:Alkylated DNA repair dioxygenase AlkB n=1 Tax=Ferrimonas sediminum TaxID=718193 RepID=A0A1G8LU18_9GAMM|nr:alpha-ketoglutarate-dependent dioxygenase AlkB [Ferrimonas sediminum]SDI58680.1 Alkylated DNA repair dioxygenase AlkB [Ferrimonas sediminum]